MKFSGCVLRSAEDLPVAVDEIYRRLRSGAKVLAVVPLRVPGLDQSSLVTQYWNMIQAQTLAEIQAAEAMLQMPFFNTMYADRAGNIFYLFGGQQPRRHGGNFDSYAKILDGTGPDHAGDADGRRRDHLDVDAGGGQGLEGQGGHPGVGLHPGPDQ